MRATILKNDILDFEIETVLEERRFSVSNEVVSTAMTLGVSLEVVGIVRILLSAGTDAVNCVGTAEFWQGGELAHMFIDLVRASHDAGVLGFVSDARRLNVLITRQTVGLWIVADERMVLTLAAQAARDNPIDGPSETGKDGQMIGAAGNSKVKKSQEARRSEKCYRHCHVRLDAGKRPGRQRCQRVAVRKVCGPSY